MALGCLGIQLLNEVLHNRLYKYSRLNTMLKAGTSNPQVDCSSRVVERTGFSTKFSLWRPRCAIHATGEGRPVLKSKRTPAGTEPRISWKMEAERGLQSQWQDHSAEP